MYYSVLRSEYIFKDWEQFEPQVEIVKKDNIYISVEKKNDEKKQVLGISSTDPADYLKQDYQPGTILN